MRKSTPGMVEKISPETRDTVNDIEIRAAGLMRSGNHAIIHWIMNQHAGHPVCFLNNVEHGDCDPHTHYAQRELVGIDSAIDVEELRNIRKRLLIYSYEDRAEFVSAETDFLASVFQPSFAANREHYLLTSRYRFDVMIIRDPFNCLASRLEMLRERGPMGGISDPDLILVNWKRFARKALSGIREPETNRIVILFNRWADDVGYRQHLSGIFMGSFSDASRDTLSSYGRGSSFDPSPLSARIMLQQWRKLFSLERYGKIVDYWKRLRTPSPRDLKIKERWKLLADDKTFRRLMADDEVLDLSEALFGEIPGIRRFVKEVKAEQ
ncbi:MAG: hypothetical protein R6U29_00835 [Desulfosudaceae bacterium]